MLRLAFDFIITWRETRTRPNAYPSAFSSSFITKVKRLNEKAEIGRKYRWNHSSYRSGIHFVCAIYNGCNVVLSVGKRLRDSI